MFSLLILLYVIQVSEDLCNAAIDIALCKHIV